VAGAKPADEGEEEAAEEEGPEESGDPGDLVPCDRCGRGHSPAGRAGGRRGWRLGRAPSGRPPLLSSLIARRPPRGRGGKFRRDRIKARGGSGELDWRPSWGPPEKVTPFVGSYLTIAQFSISVDGAVGSYSPPGPLGLVRSIHAPGFFVGLRSDGKEERDLLDLSVSLWDS